MNTLGQLCLLAAFVGSLYAGFVCIVGVHGKGRILARSGIFAAIASVLALTAVAGILAWALLARDFRFAYVAKYGSELLPWHYAAASLWAGQAGSLLVWAWLAGVLALLYRFWPRREPSRLQEPAFGILMACCGFLVAVMVFGADPMKPSLAGAVTGDGLSPLLQHPAMLIHPPIVFLGYAAWAVPFAIATAALVTGRLDAGWVKEARPWALFAWVVLGAGIILGGEWAYEELGWGGYWAWDPVENGSLIPWLTGTALIHSLLAWQYRGALKRAAVCLAVATFGLCNFAAFLTRSGIFSSVHAFSESRIGWMFLALTTILAVAGGVLIVWRWGQLTPKTRIDTVWAREAWVLISIVALLLLAAAVLVGTLTAPMSSLLLGRQITFGAAFYNNVLIPTGLLLLATIAAAPLLKWGDVPPQGQRKALLFSTAAAGIGIVAAFAMGVHNPIALAVAGLAAGAPIAWTAAWILDARRKEGDSLWFGLWRTIRENRRRYAGFLIHLGFVCLAVGVAGSSLGTRRHEVVMREGETIEWAGRSIHCARLVERELPDRLIAEAQLEISRHGRLIATVLPAEHLHLQSNQWTTEVAIHSTWMEDFYTIAHVGEGDGRVRLVFVCNPLMRWIWLGGWIFAVGALIGLWPARRRAERRSVRPSAVPAPHHRPASKKRSHTVT